MARTTRVTTTTTTGIRRRAPRPESKSNILPILLLGAAGVAAYIYRDKLFPSLVPAPAPLPAPVAFPSAVTPSQVLRTTGTVPLI